MKSWKKQSSKVLLDHKRLKVVEDMVEIHTGSIVPYLKFENTSPGSVTILCVQDDTILIQEEYSYPVDEVLYQFPGGKIEGDESPEQAGQRELLEESGYKSESSEVLGWYYPNNRRSNAKMYVILCENAYEAKKLQGDEEESIVSTWIPIADLKNMVRDGRITNFSVLSALSLYDAKMM